MKIRLLIWALLAVASGALGLLATREPENRLDSAIPFVVTLMAAGRMVKISRQSGVESEKLVNKAAVAKFFGVSKNTIDRWVAAGKLPRPIRKFGRSRWEYTKIAKLRKSRPESLRSPRGSDFHGS